MKKYLLRTIFLIVALVSTINLQAQNTDTTKNNYIVVTKKVPQFQPIILTAEALKAEEGNDFGNFEILICGQLIGDITDADKMGDFIEKAEKAGVTIVACGFSLNKFKVDRATVPKAIKIVENGILYNFQLQKQGYKSLSL
ncbi:sulfur reduction protein DsrE [Winogradskyella vidalii]|uniref:sulfur reduction protein DsrE n=1 Tax=Winogradskyella vidalii TaxID=2615024 RepID=UPI0015C98ED8|nr:sulfur reduction protein DsrE [Winogradskyella vidalii]